MDTTPNIAPIDGGAMRLLRCDQRLAQFAESERRVANRTCAPGGRELPPRYRAWEDDDEIR